LYTVMFDAMLLSDLANKFSLSLSALSDVLSATEASTQAGTSTKRLRLLEAATRKRGLQLTEQPRLFA